MEDMAILLSMMIEELNEIYDSSNDLSRLATIIDSLKQYYGPLEYNKKGVLTRSYNAATLYVKVRTGEKEIWMEHKADHLMKLAIKRTSKAYMYHVMNNL